MVTDNSKYNSQKLASYGYQSLHPGHTPLKIFLIILMHNATFSDCVNRGEKQYLPQKMTSSFRYMLFALMLPRADFIKVKPCMFHYLRDRMKLSEVSYSRFGSVGRQYAEMLVCMRTYKDITFLACAYIAETA